MYELSVCVSPYGSSIAHQKSPDKINDEKKRKFKIKKTVHTNINQKLAVTIQQKTKEKIKHSNQKRCH